jgi:hypothetical protein
MAASLFESLRRVPPERRHHYIRRGDLLLHKAREVGLRTVDELVDGLFDDGVALWATLTKPSLRSVLESASPYVLSVEGIARGDAALVDRQLRRHEPYMGVIEVHFANPLHWLLFHSSLMPSYRVVGEELRVLYSSLDGEEGQDHSRFEHWSSSGLFKAIAWEDTGLRDTIFDQFRTAEHARRVVELEDLLANHLGAMAGELLLRAGSLDPRLVEGLHGALTAFEDGGSEERLAHTCVSCRRLLVLLADTLFPPRDGEVDGRKVGPNEYRNRLWAFIAEQTGGDERGRVASELEDVGKRLDRLDGIANKGIHARELGRAETQRFLIAFLAFLYDILTLAPPPTEAPFRPYAKGLKGFADGLRKLHRRDDQGKPN